MILLAIFSEGYLEGKVARRATASRALAGIFVPLIYARSEALVSVEVSADKVKLVVDGEGLLVSPHCRLWTLQISGAVSPVSAVEGLGRKHPNCGGRTTGAGRCRRCHVLTGYGTSL